MGNGRKPRKTWVKMDTGVTFQKETLFYFLSVSVADKSKGVSDLYFLHPELTHSSWHTLKKQFDTVGNVLIRLLLRVRWENRYHSYLYTNYVTRAQEASNLALLSIKTGNN